MDNLKLHLMWKCQKFDDRILSYGLSYDSARTRYFAEKYLYEKEIYDECVILSAQKSFISSSKHFDSTVKH